MKETAPRPRDAGPLVTRLGHSDRLLDALALACELHAGQRRKGTETPYVAHLLAVCTLVIADGGSEDQAVAALLHDAVEDQGGRPVLRRIRRRFGDRVADIVDACSDAYRKPKPPWEERKRAYIEKLGTAPRGALGVSLADKVHNLGSMVADHRQIGDRLWERFTGSPEQQLWYHRELAKIFSKRVQGPLAEELVELVGELEAELAGAGG